MMALALVTIMIVGLLTSTALFTVDEREKALVFRFGEIVRSDLEPGLHWRYPLVDKLRTFDARVRTLDNAPEEYLTERKKNLVVDSFVKWRIADAADYYVTVSGDQEIAERWLSQRVNDGLREEFGKRGVEEVISGDRSQIMSVVRDSIGEQARQIGVDVLDVRLKRVDLPDAVSERVYQRMESERARVASELRAKGAEQAEEIRANADRRRRVIIADARRQAQMIRGKGDAEATRIYAGAFGRDADFYALYRSLNAYENVFDSKDDLLVLEPDSQFFKYFNDATPANDGVGPQASRKRAASAVKS